jgi:hypothetical protein
MFDFSDKDCPNKNIQSAFDRITAQYGLPGFRIDPKVAGVSDVYLSSVSILIR